MQLEPCVDLINYHTSTLVVIKQPGTSRHPNGRPITSIEMTLAEAHALYRQLNEKLHRISSGPISEATTFGV